MTFDSVRKAANLKNFQEDKIDLKQAKDLLVSRHMW
jgi:hypothetical protein